MPVDGGWDYFFARLHAEPARGERKQPRFYATTRGGRFAAVNGGPKRDADKSSSNVVLVA